MRTPLSRSQQTLDGWVRIHVRWVQRGFILFAGALVISVLIQVYITGAVFVDPANWSLHANYSASSPASKRP